MKNAVKEFPYNAFVENLNSAKGDNGAVTTYVNMKALQAEGITDPDGYKPFREKTLETMTSLQTSDELISEAVLNKKLTDHFVDGFNATSVQILQTIPWEYFYRWSPEEMQEGRLWQVFERQGRSRTWYAGSSVSFESIRSVMEYNNLLIRNMVPHSQFYNL